jgi:hypothetical protein
MEPPAVSGALKLEGVGPDSTASIPPDPVALAVTAGNCDSTEDGTVKVPEPAVVKQIKDVVVVFDPEPVLADPKISTRSDGLPPVQLRVRPELLVTVEGSPPVMFRGDPMVIDALKEPTSLPPPPLIV